MVTNLPAPCQGMSASPFLDSSLFQYDEKLVSPLLRSWPYAEGTLRFASRGFPDLARFKLWPGFPEVQPSSSVRSTKHTMVKLFHPVFPFVLFILQHPAGVGRPQLTAYVRP